MPTPPTPPQQLTGEMRRLLADLEREAVGEEIFAFAERAYSLCRSITGDGVRQTLEMLREIAPTLEIHEVASGTPVLDWTVPDEWNLRSARLTGPGGEVLADAADHSLHVMGYSVPVDRELSLEELEEHLFSDPARPAAVPYRTSYWRPHWAFCLAHEVRERLTPGTYRAKIDSSLEPGHLSYGEVVVPGESEEVVLVTTHSCHPSLANDNLSGLGVIAHLARRVASLNRPRFTYRFLFAPGTIGAITWLALHERDVVPRVRHGLVAANLGDAGRFHFKRSQRGSTDLDRAVERVLRDSGQDFVIEDFEPFGYDERQFCSPGFDLAVGCLSRTPWGRFPEYHSSDDDLSLIAPAFLGESLERYLEV
ncbi:MAG: DUF4910 domain-containing protein, partial [Acidobacteriota bacterium]